MTHLRFNGCAPVRSNYEASNDLMKWVLNDFGSSYSGQSVPLANIIEAKDDYRIEMAIPGFAKNEIKIKLDGQILNISSEVPESEEDQNERPVRHEFSKKSFSRSFRLSNWIDSGSIAAKSENGILIVTIPKLEEAKAKPAKDIEIV